IFSSPLGTYYITDSIDLQYNQIGGWSSRLGFPISDAYPFCGGLKQDFEGGSLTSGVTASLTLNPPTLSGGGTTTGTVTISGAAPLGGVVVSLTSSDTTAATVPVNVTISEGATTAPFTITTNQRNTSAIITIGAAVADLAPSAPLTISASVPTVTITS